LESKKYRSVIKEAISLKLALPNNNLGSDCLFVVGVLILALVGVSLLKLTANPVSSLFLLFTVAMTKFENSLSGGIDEEAKPWEVGRVARGYWQKKENRIRAVNWLFEKFDKILDTGKFEDLPTSWRRFFEEKRLGALLTKKYRGISSQAFEEAGIEIKVGNRIPRYPTREHAERALALRLIKGKEIYPKSIEREEHRLYLAIKREKMKLPPKHRQIGSELEKRRREILIDYGILLQADSLGGVKKELKRRVKSYLKNPRNLYRDIKRVLRGMGCEDKDSDMALLARMAYRKIQKIKELEFKYFGKTIKALQDNEDTKATTIRFINLLLTTEGNFVRHKLYSVGKITKVSQNGERVCITIKFALLEKEKQFELKLALFSLSSESEYQRLFKDEELKQIISDIAKMIAPLRKHLQRAPIDGKSKSKNIRELIKNKGKRDSAFRKQFGLLSKRAFKKGLDYEQLISIALTYSSPSLVFHYDDSYSYPDYNDYNEIINRFVETTKRRRGFFSFLIFTPVYHPTS
jgi:hypothetical protein